MEGTVSLPARKHVSAKIDFIRNDWGRSDMHRVISSAVVALLAFGSAIGSALGDEICDKGKGDDSIAACSRLIEQNPKFAAAYNNRGLAYQNKRDYDRAIADYNEAIRLDAQNTVAYNNRGNTHLDKGENDRAIADYDEAIRFNPKYAIAYNGRGNAYKEKGNYDRAIADYNEASRLDPKYPLAYNGRATAYWLKGDYDRAIAEYSEAIRLDPKFAVAYGNRGSAYEKKGDYPRAVADYDESLKLDPNYAFARDGRKRVAAVWQPPPLAPTERRVALVIGNSKYAAVPLLPNPRRDAEAVAQALREAGFQTTVTGDLDRAAMRKALRAFRDAADKADWALVYFAGHGIQIGKANYLIPIDAALRDERDVEDETVSYSEVERAIEGARALRIIILDACRADPFERQMVRRNAVHASVRGLSPPPDTRPGLLVVYSARDGQFAEDGIGDHSPFATALIAHLKDRGREVRRMFDDVSADVLDATDNRQQPFTYGSLPGRKDFYFVAGK
jgi:tetratricopeptide (TPR) repeat protein